MSRRIIERAAAILVALFIVLTWPASAYAGWLTTDVDPGPGFASLAFDDSAWIPAYAPYPNDVSTPQEIMPGTPAQFMWYWNSVSPPDVSKAVTQAWFRYTFTLTSAEFQSPPHLDILADDYYQLWINGDLWDNSVNECCFSSAFLDDRIQYNNDHGCPIACNLGTPMQYDVNQAFVAGENVIAIYAFDGNSADGPFNRHNQYVLLDALLDGFTDGSRDIRIVSGNIPEPGPLYLLGTALLLAGMVCRRNRPNALTTIWRLPGLPRDVRDTRPVRSILSRRPQTVARP